VEPFSSLAAYDEWGVQNGFPLFRRAKGFASSLTTAIFYMLTFATTKLYLSVQDALGLSNTFFMLTVSSFLGLVYLYKFMPETENRTLMEIENFFVPKTENALQSPGP